MLHCSREAVRGKGGPRWLSHCSFRVVTEGRTRKGPKGAHLVKHLVHMGAKGRQLGQGSLVGILLAAVSVLFAG